MKVGDIFDLPDNVVRKENRTGIFRDEKTKAKVGKWQIVKINNELKGKVIVTYGHKRTHNEVPDNGWIISIS